MDEEEEKLEDGEFKGEEELEMPPEGLEDDYGLQDPEDRFS